MNCPFGGHQRYNDKHCVACKVFPRIYRCQRLQVKLHTVWIELKMTAPLCLLDRELQKMESAHRQQQPMSPKTEMMQ